MKRVTTDPSKKLTIYSRIGVSNTKRFSFFNADGTDYDLSGVTLSIGIKRPRFLEDVITLTSGSGLTISGNNVDLELTSVQSANFDERVYYFELRRVISGKQKVWLNGDHIWHKGTFDAFNDNGTNITIDDNGEDILITINEAGGSSGGGAVDSVNGQTGVVVLDADDIDDTSTTHKFVTSTDITKLSNLSGTNTGDAPLTNGSGTTASGTSVNLGGVLTDSVIINGEITHSIIFGFDSPLNEFYFDGVGNIYLYTSTGDLTLYRNVTKIELTDDITFYAGSIDNTERFKIKSTGDIEVSGSVGTIGQVLTSGGDGAPPTWETISGGGAVDSVNGATGVVVLDADDIDDSATTNKFVTSTDITKLSNLSGTNTGDQDLSSYATLTGTQTLTNKRITQRVQSVASSATVTANADTNDMVIITAQAEALTLANPTGTPTEGQGLIYRIKDNGTARTIGYGANFRALGITLPTTTVISKTLYLACVWNVADSKWDVIGERQEA
jgi:hypothetical protein